MFNTGTKESSFSPMDSLVIKGAAILIMMWHHCFLSGRFEDFQISFVPFTMNQVASIAAFSKICVSLFAFVSGYGLYLSYKKECSNGVPANKSVRWLWVRYVRSFSGFWIIVILSWVVCAIVDFRPRTIYFGESAFSGVIFMVIDFLGLSNLFGTPSMIGTWWYMSAAFVFIMVTPVLFSFMNRFGSFSCFAIILVIPRIIGGYPGGIAFYTFIPAFFFGMAAAKMELFSFIDCKLFRNQKQIVKIGFFCALSLVCYKISHHIPTDKLWEIKWGFFPVVYVVTIYLLFRRTCALKKGMAFIGKHSANVFMIHTFIRDTYFRDFIYSRGHFLLIILVLFVISLCCSILVEWMKRLINYNRMVSALEAINYPINL